MFVSFWCMSMCVVVCMFMSVTVGACVYVCVIMLHHSLCAVDLWVCVCAYFYVFVYSCTLIFVCFCVFVFVYLCGSVSILVPFSNDAYAGVCRLWVYFSRVSVFMRVYLCFALVCLCVNV